METTRSNHRGGRIDDCLSERQGVLFIEDVPAPQLVGQFGSPLFVTSEDQIRRNVRRYASAFGTAWSRRGVRVLPAAKANWSLAVQRVLADEGCGADVYSEGELDVVLRAGVPASMISASGVPKSPAHVRRTLASGARLTVDSLEDVRCLEACAPDLRATASVRLRLRPAVSRFVHRSDFAHDGLIPSDVAALTYKGGLSFEEAVEAGRRIANVPHLRLNGFHQHHGRHSAGLAWWEAQMTAYARMIAETCRALGGVRLQDIDVGGGFAMPRDPHNAATNYGAPLTFGLLHLVSRVAALGGPALRYKAMRALAGSARMTPNTRPAPTIEEYATTVCRTLGRELEARGIDTSGVTLEIEPGRGLLGDAGVHLTTVRAIKRQRSPLPWTIIVVDTSEFFLAAGRFERHLHQYVVANRMGAVPTMVADVVGCSCFADRLLPSVQVPDVAVGDTFAFFDTGAYQEASAGNFNALTRPASVLVTGTQAHLCRPAETLEAVLGRERVPHHLMASRRVGTVGTIGPVGPVDFVDPVDTVDPVATVRRGLR